MILTRPKPAILRAQSLYESAGLKVLAVPCVDLLTNPAINAAWLSGKTQVWVVPSVHALAHALTIDPNWRPQTDTRVIAVGPAVQAAWEKHFSHPIQVHPSGNSEGVIELLKDIQPNSLHIYTAAGGRDLIQSYCMRKQINYTQLNTYVRQALALDKTAIAAACVSGSILTVTSVGVLQHLSAELPAELWSRLKSGPLVTGSERITQAAMHMGFVQVTTADGPSDQAMCQAAKALVPHNSSVVKY